MNPALPSDSASSQCVDFLLKNSNFNFKIKFFMKNSSHLSSIIYFFIEFVDCSLHHHDDRHRICTLFVVFCVCESTSGYWTYSTKHSLPLQSHTHKIAAAKREELSYHHFN